jgi:ribonuclease R
VSGLPSRDELLDWIRENPAAASKREIARAFGIRGADRVELKRLLRELQDEGLVARERKRMRPAGTLPPVTVLEVTGPDAEGDLAAVPTHWEGEGQPPRVLIAPKKGDPALGARDRVLAKLRRLSDGPYAYEARLIKKLESGARRMLGIFRAGPQGGRLVPIDKRADREWTIPPGGTGGAEDGELVEAEGVGGPRLGLPKGRIVERHGRPGDARQVSLIAMVEHGIPYEFGDEVLAEAAKARPVRGLDKREDLRGLPLITIDPADARDHDDAVCALPDEDPRNPGGHVVWVAIADVAHYVRPGGALDREALDRGNSTYFPDRVSPMLPEELSADLCSLVEGADRPCLAVRMALDAHGNKLGHRFARALMRSPASLSYEQVQEAADGGGGLDAELTVRAIRPLYAAYRAAAAARERRQPLELDLPERRIELDDEGAVTDIRFRERLEAHRLIEEFMILANVAAAETLEAHRTPLIYRVHEEPAPERLESLREILEPLGLQLARGQVLQTRHFNQLLARARGTEAAETVGMSVLRAQTQAYYSPQNLGHFGLNLPRYAHFTSPIRRYADLVVHRALIRALDLGRDGLSADEIARLQETAEHISTTERRSMEAERDTVDRYLAAYLSDRIGAEFRGRVSGVSRAGAFVKLDETGADGLVPISTLGSDYFRHDPERQTLTGERTGRVIGLGQPVTVRLREAAPITGGLILELLSVDGARLASPRRGGGRKAGRERLARAKAARARRRG